jgi:hypothetical protein
VLEEKRAAMEGKAPAAVEAPAEEVEVKEEA